MTDEGVSNTIHRCITCDRVYDFKTPEMRIKIIRDIQALPVEYDKSHKKKEGTKYYEGKLNYPGGPIRDALDDIKNKDEMDKLMAWEERARNKQFRNKTEEAPYYLQDGEVVEIGTSFARSLLTQK